MRGSIVEAGPLSTCRAMPVVPSGLATGASANDCVHDVDGGLQERMALHVVDLEEDVLVQRVGAHRRQVEVDRPVAVGVDAVLLPEVGQRVAVGVRRLLADDERERVAGLWARRGAVRPAARACIGRRALTL